MLTKADHPTNAFEPLTLAAAYFVSPSQGVQLREVAFVYGPEAGERGVYTLRVQRRTKDGGLSLGEEFASPFDSLDEALLAAGPTEQDLPGCRVEFLRRGAGEDSVRFRARVGARTALALAA